MLLKPQRLNLPTSGLHRRRAEHRYGVRVEGKGGIGEALGVRVAEADCHEQGTLPSLGVATVQQYTPS